MKTEQIFVFLSICLFNFVHRNNTGFPKHTSCLNHQRDHKMLRWTKLMNPETKKIVFGLGLGLVFIYSLVCHGHNLRVITENLKIANELPSLLMKRWYSLEHLTSPASNENVTSALWRVPVDEINSKAVKGGIWDFLPNYKNPCWFQGSVSASGVRCLPYFYLAGVAKCGTTALFDQLVKHPNIFPAASKELNFWQFPRKHNVDGYLRMFTASNKYIYKDEEEESGYHTSILFEATPNIFNSNYGVFGGYKNTKPIEPSYTLAHTLYALNPATRIVVTLRNPTERLFSHYHFRYERHFHLSQYSAEEFDGLAKKAVGLMSECLRTKPLRACAFDEDLCRTAKQEQSMTICSGMYYPYAAEWISVFPRNQLMFIKAEEMYRNATKTVIELFNFLKIGQPPPEIMRDITTSMSRKYAKERKKDATNASYRDKMLPQTRTLVDNFYDQFNVKMAQLLDNDKWLFRRE